MGVTGSDLLSGTGELTAAGGVFVDTYKDLQRCESYSSSMLSATPLSNNEEEDVIAASDIAGKFRQWRQY